MEVIDPRCTLLTNAEVLDLLREVKNNSKKSAPKTTQRNHSTVVFETMKYLNDTPAAAQKQQDVVKLVKALAPFKLTGAEIVQICNLRPKQQVLELIVEEAVERLSEEQAEELVQLVNDHLPKPVPKANKPTANSAAAKGTGKGTGKGAAAKGAAKGTAKG